MQQVGAQLWLSPSDLTGFLACPHLTTLAHRDAAGGAPRTRSAEAELLAAKGMVHERRFLEQWQNAGRRVVEIRPPNGDGDWGRAAEETRAAMHAGADVIYQGVFVEAPWRGIADFLVKCDTPSDLGTWSYEAWDTKLASRAKPAFVLQLAFYSEQLARLQGTAPEQMHIVPGTGKTESFRVAYFGSYYRRVRQCLLRTLETQPATAPYPVSHCRVCHYADACTAQWQQEDHLCRVARITRPQVQRLQAAGVPTLAALGAVSDTSLPGLRATTVAVLRDQARLQHDAEQTGYHRYELLDPRGAAGFAQLPSPSPGDVYFDMEGDPYFEGLRGLEYLFGVMTIDQGVPAFRSWVALTRDEERQAFEGFIDDVRARLERWPDLHVYHYAAYEKTALRRLASSHGTREREVEELLVERQVFVDLYDVVRHALRISKDSYSIKALRTFFMEVETGAVNDGGQSILVFEHFLETHDPEQLQAIIDYNREDCRSTVLLHQWLLARRQEAEAQWQCAIPWLVPDRVPPSPARVDEDARVVAQCAALRAKATVAATVLAELLPYHQREARPAWVRYFDRLHATADEWMDDADAVGGLHPTGAPPVTDKQSLVQEFVFPPQEVRLLPGTSVIDPHTKRSAGTLTAIDVTTRRLWLKRGKRRQEPWPQALVASGPIDDAVMRAALGRLADAELQDAGHYLAGRRLAAREYPAIRGRVAGARLQTMDPQAQSALVQGLDQSYLVVQGPPGSGKTWLAGRLITELVQAGYRVGVSSLSHKAINNVLAAVERVWPQAGEVPIGLKKCTDEADAYEGQLVRNTFDVGECDQADVRLLAGTGWLFCREALAERFDYLFVDEAGQLSLADVVAMSTAARNLVLLGDPQQLPQIQQGMQPAAAQPSVLEHVLGLDDTVPPNRGLFLERTYRLHPRLCAFVSALAYDHRLVSAPACARQAIRSAWFSGAGFRWLAVPHTGNSQQSKEEAEAVASAIGALLAEGTVTQSDGHERRLQPEDVLVVAPYNLQVQLLQRVVPDGVQVGTVDKFQGREAPVVFYALATSSADDAPRGLDFLLDTHRLNVAMSRARVLAVLVCAPQLLEATCSTVEQMRMLNGFCLLAELAFLPDSLS